MKKIFLLSVSLLIAFSSFGKAVLSGKVIGSDSGEVLIGANVLILKNGIRHDGVSTDLNGFYKIAIDAGNYSVVVSYVGYAEKQIDEVVIKNDEPLNLDFQLNAGVALCEVVVKDYKTTSIKHCSGFSTALTSSSHSTTKGSGLRKTTIVDTRPKMAISTDQVTYYNSRSDATDFYIDGIQVRSEVVPKEEFFLTGTEAAFEKDRLSEKETTKQVRKNTAPKIKGGILTAGEWNGLEDWDYWNNLLETQDEQYQKQWNISPTQRFAVEVINQANFPLPDCTVKLLDKSGTIIWQSKTDNKGKAELWANLFGGEVSNFKIKAEFDEVSSALQKAFPFSQKINKIKLPISCQSFKNLDLAFVVDATGSMRDEINYLKAELRDVIEQVQKNDRVLNIRTSSIFYRDRGDEYITRIAPFSNNLNKTIGFIANQGAAGGGDTPEAVEIALQEALSLDWSEKTIGRILFLVLDAPPRNNPKVLKSLQNQIKKAAEVGIRIVPISASGINKSTEFLMKSFALATNGTYVFITDHSGIGNPHLEASVSEYTVEMLNDLMFRLIVDFSSLEDCNSSKVSRKLAIAEGVNHSSSQSKYLNQMIYFYPNPTDNHVSIELSEQFSSVQLINVTGKIVKSINYPDIGINRLDVSDLPGGAYLIRFQKGTEVITKRLVVAKP